eukprot:TRINITY_DN3494_c0_g1_i1.p1 TRINITY_DN3494_c0_g1~~TRINITY_DN3494_c0_g1_i1.p1  ORF type:complete len:181 (+),score=18.92 TRINITY_DN3494_c0_g1_i1:64-606(+)
MSAISKKCSIVVCVDCNGGIGKNGTLPWKLPAEIKRFSVLTKATQSKNLRNAVIMGRKTFESIPAKFRPLPDRLNVVVSTTLAPSDGITVCPSVSNAVRICSEMPDVEQTFIIGGVSVYQEALNLSFVQTIHLTQLHQQFDCDVFFDVSKLEAFSLTEQSEVHEEQGLTYTFCTYRSTPM